MLDIDQIRQIVIPNSRQSQEHRDIAYRCMHLVSEKLLDVGANTILLTATYSRRNPRQWLRSLADGKSAQVCILACKVSPEIAIARFRSRAPGHPAVDLTEELVQRQVMDYPYGSRTLLNARFRYTNPLRRRNTSSERVRQLI